MQIQEQMQFESISAYGSEDEVQTGLSDRTDRAYMLWCHKRLTTLGAFVTDANITVGALKSEKDQLEEHMDTPDADLTEAKAMTEAAEQKLHEMKESQDAAPAKAVALKRKRNMTEEQRERERVGSVNKRLKKKTTDEKKDRQIKFLLERLEHAGVNENDVLVAFEAEEERLNASIEVAYDED